MRAIFFFCKGKCFVPYFLPVFDCLGSDVGRAFPYVDNVGYSVGVEANFAFAVESPNDVRRSARGIG